MVAPVEQQATQDPCACAEPEPSIRHLVDQLKARTYEFGAYAKYLVSLKLDSYKLTAKRVALYAALGVGALAVLTAVLLFSTGLLLLGLAGLLGQLFNNFWLGATVLGLLMLILPAVGAWVGLRMFEKKAMAALRLKYADIRQKQKKAFGRDIKEMAHA